MTTAGPFLSEAKKQDIGERYLGGAALEAVAEAVALDADTVSAVLADMGIPLRPAADDGRPPLIAGEVAAAYNAGASIRDIARSTGRGYGTIHRVLAESGISFRPRGAPTGHRIAPL